MRERGEVVVRVRKIAEDRAAIAAASSVAAAHAAGVAADTARNRSRQHPLAGRAGGMNISELSVAVGTGAALREAAAVARVHEEHTRTEALKATKAVIEARAHREAAERFLERRRAATALDNARKDQRQLDESALATWRTA